MSNEIDPARVYSRLADLYKEAEMVHRASGDALVEIINALSRKTAADAKFLAAFQHLVARPLQEPMPSEQPEPEAPHAFSSRMPWDEPMPASGPPPLPTGYPVAPPGTYDDGEVGYAFEQRLSGIGRRTG